MVRFALAVALLVIAARAEAKSAEVEAQGLALVEKNDEPAARQKALNHALTQAIALVAGQWVQSHFTATQSEHTKNNETTFLSRVEDTVKTNVEGFVETYKIVKEERAGDTYRVSVKATVNTRKLDDLFGALQDALEKKKQKALVVAREIDGEGKPVQGQVAAFVENELTKVGIELTAHGTPSKTADVLALADNEGKQSGADIVLLVEAKYKNLGVIGPGAEFEALVGQTRVELEIVLRSALVKQRRVLSSKPVTMTSIGTNSDRAIARALSGKGQNAIRQTTQDFFAELLKELQKTPAAEPVAAVPPPNLRLVIERVKSFKKLGRPLIDLIGKASGVTNVQQKTFAGDKLELQVEYKGDQSALERFIFDECEKQRFCRSIDRKSSAQNELVLSL